MTLSALYPPPADLAKNAHIKSKEQYDKMYKQSLEDPDAFWSDQADAFHWTKRWKSPVLEYVRQDCAPPCSCKSALSGVNQPLHCCLSCAQLVGKPSMCSAGAVTSRLVFVVAFHFDVKLSYARVSVLPGVSPHAI